MKKTWIHFICALGIYWTVDLCVIHGGYGFKEYILSIFAWESVGNSTWFVFCILICWGATWIAFKIFHKKKQAYAFLWILLLIYVLVIKVLKNEHAWYDTILCYPFGMYLAFKKENLEKLLSSNFKTGLLVLFASFWFVMRLFVEKNVVTYSLQSILFAVFMLCICSRVTINNKILQWLGNHTFSIYILQRIPMSLLAFYGMDEFGGLYTLLCLGFTCILAYYFDMMVLKIDKKWMRR